MKESGFYEPDVCLICGANSYVGRTHRAILDHVIENHLSTTTRWSFEVFTCWCGFACTGYDGKNGIYHHLGDFVKDLNMTFPTSVEQLWAHYHAAMLGATPEKR